MKSRISKLLAIIISLTIAMLCSVEAVALANSVQPALTAKSIDESVMIDFPEMETSLGIDFPNVNLDLVPNNYLLTSSEKDTMRKYFPELDEITLSNMTVTEMKEYENAQLMSEAGKKSFLTLNPNLTMKDIENWTWGDRNAYITEKNNQPINSAKLTARGITDSDARYLLKEYEQIEDILSESDAVLKEYLLTYYRNKLEFAKDITNPQTEVKAVPGAKAPPTSLQGTTYRWVTDMSNYISDWFHVNSNSYISSVNGSQAEGAYFLYTYIFNTSISPNPNTSYRYSNMWGTWSNSQQGAHEGIDMVYSTVARDCRAIFAGTKGIYTTNSGAQHLYLQSTAQGRVFYGHMGGISGTPSTVTKGDVLGYQSDVGNSTGVHLHFEAASYGGSMKTGNDNILSSSDPYSINW